MGAGYTPVAPITAAPGQVLNLFVQGVGNGLTGRVAAPGFPLPLTLAGISVTLQQSLGAASVPVPIFAVEPMSTCILSVTQNCGRYVAITVQVPYELTPNFPGAVQPQNSARLVVSENGAAGTAIELNPAFDQVHILTTCEISKGASAGCVAGPAVRHQDGTLVTAARPAIVGETLTMYAYGLGATTPGVATGTAAPSPGPKPNDLFRLHYNYTANALPYNPPFRNIICEAIQVCPFDPAFIGLVPNDAGLYQVNFVVPPPPPGTPSCSFQAKSNLTVSLYGVSFDGAGICVAAGGF